MEIDEYPALEQAILRFMARDEAPAATVSTRQLWQQPFTSGYTKTQIEAVMEKLKVIGLVVYTNFGWMLSMRGYTVATGRQ